MARSNKDISSRKTIFLTAISIFAFVIWSSNAEIDQVSRAAGQVIPSGRIQVLQSIEGGVIKEINVKEGDFVEAGDVLIILESERILSSINEAFAKLTSFKVVKARIEAELFGRPLVFKKDVMKFPDFVENQQKLYERRLEAHSEEIQNLEELMKLSNTELELVLPLIESGDVSKSDILRLKRSIAEVAGQIANRRNAYLQELQAEYSKVEEEIAFAEQILTQRRISLEGTTLKAPTNGIVKNVRLTTVGGVLKPSDEVLQLVPTGKELIVEAKVSPSDIANIRTGLKALVKFDAYDYTIFGAADGEVIFISPDTISEKSFSGDQSYYLVHIRLDISVMRPVFNEEIVIQPGMTSTVEILTGRNTILRYLFKPIIKTIGSSLQER